LGIASDTSLQRQFQNDLIVARDKLNIAASLSNLGVWTWSVCDNKLVWNDRMYEMCQQPKELCDTGLYYEHWCSRLHPEDAQAVQLLLKNASEGNANFNTNFRIILPDGSTHYIEAAAQLERDSTGKIVRMTGMNLDITGQYNYEKLLSEMVYTDGLTGIPNRRCFEGRVDVELRQARRDPEPLAMLMIDVDFFKLYNDTYGHQAGDVCIRAIATTLKSNLLRHRDFVARYGGEEFICILPKTDLIGVRKIAMRLLKAIKNLGIKHSTSKVSSVVTLSIGFAVMHPKEEISSESLIACADAQLYQAKNGGRNRVCGAWLNKV